MTSIRILVGDSLDRLAELPENSVDSIVCDPPYGLKFMGKRWDADVPKAELWAAGLRVLKPGGHLLASFGTRTYHRGVVAVEDAGFEIRDMVAWLHGQGMPKSVDIGKVLDEAAGAEREVVGSRTKLDAGFHRVSGTGTDQPQFYRTHDTDITAPSTDAAKEFDGWGTGLSPGLEPIVLARKPLIGTIPVNVLEHGTGGINIDACRIPRGDGYADNCVVQGPDKRPSSFARRDEAAKFQPSKLGGWPANVCHDGSQRVLDLFPQTQPKRPTKGDGRRCDTKGNGWGMKRTGTDLRDDGGSAARYFYTAKPSGSERDAGLGGEAHTAGERAGGRAEGSAGLANPRAGTNTEGFNDHPTVKPIALMRWMVRLVTPAGGTVLDPFMGSGSTGIAAHLEGFDFIGIELDPHHAATAELRIRHYAGDDGIVSEAPSDEVGSRTPERAGFFV